MRLLAAAIGLAIVPLAGCQSSGSAVAPPPEVPTEVPASLQSTPEPIRPGDPALVIFDGEREILRTGGLGRGVIPVQAMKRVADRHPTYVLYARCAGASGVQVVDAGPARVRWSVPCDGVPSRREVFTTKGPLRPTIAAAGTTQWSFVITQAT